MWQEYVNASSVDEALGLLAERGERARIVAGATDLILEMELGVRKGINTLSGTTSARAWAGWASVRRRPR